MSFPEAVNGADISPIPFEAVSEQLVIAVKHRRDNVFTEIMAGGRICGIAQQMILQVSPLEQVNSHRSKIALRHFRFFRKLGNLEFFVNIHHAEAACFIPRNLHY
ncbi:hypothetical protein D3C74_401200 [compost metagenome]